MLCAAVLKSAAMAQPRRARCEAAAAIRPTPSRPNKHPPAQWPLSKDVLEGTFGRSTRDRTVAMTLAADRPASSSWSAWLPCSMNLRVRVDTSSGT
jgi:hypothetical protein